MTVEQNDVIKAVAEFNYKLGGDLQLNTYHFEYQDLASLSDATVFTHMGTILEELYGNLIAAQPAAYKYTQYRAYNVTQDTLLGAAAWPTFTAGTGTGELVAPQIAALVIARTQLSRVQARKYLGGFDEGDIQEGQWDAALESALDAYAVDLLRDDIIGALTFAPIAYNALLDRRQPLLSALPILQARTQRRRTLGRGA